MASYLKCPHCGYKLRTRNSTGQHPLLRTEYLECQNPGCHATFRGEREITHEISPSGLPNPAINLPKAPRALNEHITLQLLGGANQLDWVRTADTESDQPEENTND